MSDKKKFESKLKIFVVLGDMNLHKFYSKLFSQDMRKIL